MIFPETETLCSWPRAVRKISSCQSVSTVPNLTSAGTPITVGTKALNSSPERTSSFFATVPTENAPV
ncbi:hypothetical protein EVA_17822 [gut metagenome]|uniref:Uncharacterized protein n=1 Tax=gut metagenome TaxID=749906 RepID=J9FGQ5_9ZZZZ